MKVKIIWIILVFIFCCGVSTTMAQSDKFSAGLKVGFGIPNLTSGAKSTPLSEGYSSRYGFYGGIISELKLGGGWGLRAEINYSSQGGRREGLQALPLYPEAAPLWQLLPSFGITPDEYMYVDIRSEAILNYLEIPVMAKYSFNIGSRINLYLQAGPYMGISLNARNITSGSSIIYVDKTGTVTVDQILEQLNYDPIGPQPFDHNENISSDIHRFNVGGQGAIGFGLLTKRGELFIEGGGNYGFIPIQKDEANGTNNTGAGTVTIGYLINL